MNAPTENGLATYGPCEVCGASRTVALIDGAMSLVCSRDRAHGPDGDHPRGCVCACHLTPGRKADHTCSPTLAEVLAATTPCLTDNHRPSAVGGGTCAACGVSLDGRDR